ncbi:MAG TPA: winged helix-turn-helix transcriptional regulator, partial [Chloroflexota bacterium]
MQSTRWEILQLLKRRGRATVQELAKALDMTLMGVRLHLVVVERDGYVRRSTLREKPGRPAMVYSLTPKAEELFPKRYDLLAEKLLDAMGRGPAEEHAAVLADTAHELAAPFLSKLNGAGRGGRVEQVGHVLEEIGGFASWEKIADGYLIHQYNCLYYRVAERKREVCSMCSLFLEEMLGVAPQARNYLMDGAGRCTYFVPND